MARSPLTKPEGRPGARPPGRTIEMKERRLPAGDGARFVFITRRRPPGCFTTSTIVKLPVSRRQSKRDARVLRQASRR